MAMEKTAIVLLLDEAIRLENNVSDLYKKFFHHHDDYEFWWKLAMEEKNHASLLRAGKEYYLDCFPREILPEALTELKAANRQVEEYLNSAVIPDRATRFKIALELEDAAGEIHYQRAMEAETGGPMLVLFQKLNNEDKDHAARIRAYRRENDLELP